MNPADLSSRGAHASALMESFVWFKGYDWLGKPEPEWPRSTEPTTAKILEEIEEKAKLTEVVAPILAAARATPSEGKLVGWKGHILNNYGSYMCMVRTMTLCLRTLCNSRRLDSPPKTPTEMAQKRVRHQNFPNPAATERTKGCVHQERQLRPRR